MNEQELQWRLIYAALVAGKSSRFAEEKTKLLMGNCAPGELPFNMLYRLLESGKLLSTLKKARTGNYTKMNLLFTALLAKAATLDLETCTPEDLEEIPGIGPKTSRFFILWTRKDARHAALDVHILRWLRSLGHKTSKQTPPNGKAYRRLEEIFLQEADKRGLTPRELDAQIWSEGSGREYDKQLSVA